LCVADSDCQICNLCMGLNVNVMVHDSQKWMYILAIWLKGGCSEFSVASYFVDVVIYNWHVKFKRKRDLHIVTTCYH
jgi:hypothetical protein